MTAPERVTSAGRRLRSARSNHAIAVAALERALEAEARRSFDDGSVKGGFDRLLDRLIDEKRLAPGSPLARAIRDLRRIAYASLPPAGRSQWAGTLQSLLGREPPQRRNSSSAQYERDGQPSTAPAAVGTPPASTVHRTKVPALASLDSPIDLAPGVNRTSAPKLRALGIESIHDLLYHFPHRYEDFSRVRPIAQLAPGEQQTLIASIWTAAEKQMGRQRKGTELIVGDATGNLRVVFFNQPYLAARFHTGARIVLSGRVSIFQNQRQMDSPEWELLEGSDLAQAVHTGRLVPVYPLTAGLSARSLRRIISMALELYAPLLRETLPAGLLQRHELPSLSEAVRQIHYPDSERTAEQARRRLAFDELLALEIAVLDERRQRSHLSRAVALPLPPSVQDQFLRSLPFTLTAAQQGAAGQIIADLALDRPMARLLQGDVGSGKTVVAALGLLAAVSNGRQAVLMAPTEILAEQHFRTLCHLFRAGDGDQTVAEATFPSLPHPLRIGLLHGGLNARAKASSREALAGGTIDIAVGTQALIQEGVQLDRLGFAVVDEQHRFGVVQRAALRDKGHESHLLVMTATPIPRTLQLTLYGDLELSVIDQLPPGRRPVVTRFIRPEERWHAYRFLRDEIDAGNQVFVICPLVEESEKLEARAATEEFERLSALDVFAGVSMGLLHGRMRPRDKEAIMRDFYEQRSQILVSTAVVEVGIDVANASVILIEGADRFGLAQLHQFRGRVGRGSQQSYCLLVADNPSPEAAERLRLMEKIQDGFRLAEADLRLRGPGEYFGTRQSGMPDLRVARLTDVELLDRARSEATSILDSSGALDAEEWSALREQVRRLRRLGGEVN